MSSSPVLNLSAYKFVALADAARLRSAIFEQAQQNGLLGTVLLAEEGINLFLAGEAGALQGFMAWLRSDARLHDLAAKESWSESVPFRHLRVKLKREIIRMNCPAVRPQTQRAPAVDATTLARWLSAGHDDDGRTVVLLDTRNGFEVDQGRFDGALDWRLRKFSDFPGAAREHAAQLREHTVVTYCTGGIRCEKAALVLREAGVPHALQLDGGILTYLERLPGAPHWQGQCFVFDARGSLDAHLQGEATGPGAEMGATAG